MPGGFIANYIAMVSPAIYCVEGVSPGDWLNLRAWPSAQSRVPVRIDRHTCGIALAKRKGVVARRGLKEAWSKRTSR